jgi:hypothetical protein
MIVTQKQWEIGLTVGSTRVEYASCIFLPLLTDEVEGYAAIGELLKRNE